VRADLLREDNSDGTFETRFATSVTGENGDLNFSDLPRGAYRVALDTSTIPSGFFLVSETLDRQVELGSGQGIDDSGFGVTGIFQVVSNVSGERPTTPIVTPAELDTTSGVSVLKPDTPAPVLFVGEFEEATSLIGFQRFRASETARKADEAGSDEVPPATRFGSSETMNQAAEVVLSSAIPEPLSSVATDEVIGDVFSLSDDVSSSLLILPSFVEADAPPSNDTLGVILGRVFEDLDRDGEFDAAFELGIGGQRVYLDLNSNGKLDPEEPVASTDKDGQFAFSDLEPGEYTITADPASQWRHSESVPGVRHVDLQFGQPEVRDVDFAVTAPQDIDVASLSETKLPWWMLLPTSLLSIGWVVWIVRRRRRQQGDSAFWQSSASTRRTDVNQEVDEDADLPTHNKDEGTVRGVSPRKIRP